MLRFTQQEEVQNEKEQNMYSIIQTMETLEWAYMNGHEGTDYEKEWNQLYHQYTLVKQTLPQFDINRFARAMQLEHCQAAIIRLSAGKSSFKAVESSAGFTKLVFDYTSALITTSDTISMSANPANPPDALT